MIAVIGEALIDMVATDHSPSAALLPYPGGSPSNVALSLAAQGQEVAFLGQLANDPWGKYLRNNFIKYGVNVDYLTSSTNSRHLTALALVQPQSNGENNYSFYLDNAADLKLSRHFLRPPKEQIEALVFGSYSIATPSFRAAVEPFLWQSSLDSVVSFDPNIRTSIISSSADYLKDWERWLDLCDIIKMSDEDYYYLFNNTAEEQIIKACFARRVSLLLISRGADGVSLYHCSGKQLHCSLALEQLSDTIGAGDTLHGALLAFLNHHGYLQRQLLANLNETQLRCALRWAVSAATLNCQRRGCSPPTWDEVAELVDN